MIIVQLKGGLGNQLFQYAAGLSLATHHNVEVKVDLNELKRPDDQIGTFRNYELQHIAAPPAIASQTEVDQFLKISPIQKVFDKLQPPYKRNIYKEQSFNFDKNFFMAGSHIYLKGYRQSEQYFQPIHSTIFKQLHLQSEVYNKVIPFAEKLKATNSIAIHIRRGDYKDPTVVDYHGILPPAYYQQAIKHFTNTLANPQFYIFSDDVEWVKNNLSCSLRLHFCFRKYFTIPL